MKSYELNPICNSTAGCTYCGNQQTFEKVVILHAVGFRNEHGIYVITLSWPIDVVLLCWTFAGRLQIKCGTSWLWV